MDYKLSINIPGLPKGAEVQIAGLDTFENGKEYIVSSDEHDNFRRYHGQVVPTYNDQNEVTGSTLELGPTLLQANIHGVKADTVKETAAEKKARKEQEEKEKAERDELEASRRSHAAEKDFDLAILTDAEVDSWIFDPESAVAQDAEAKMVVARTEKGDES